MASGLGRSIKNKFKIDNSFPKGFFFENEQKTTAKLVKAIDLESATIYLGRDWLSINN